MKRRRVSVPFSLEEREALARRQAGLIPIICPDVDESYHREAPWRTKGALAVFIDGLICSDCGKTIKTIEIEDDRERVQTRRSGPATETGPL